MPAREDVRNSACAFLLGVSVAVVHPLVLVAYRPENKDAVDIREPVLIACYALFAFGVVYGVSCSRHTLEVGEDGFPSFLAQMLISVRIELGLPYSL